MRNKKQDSFIERARQIHNDKYDYSKVEYVNNSTKVCIICPIHGEFWQRPNNHLQGQGCPKCANEKNGKNKRNTKEFFIKKAKEIHGDKYDYSKVVYKGNKTKVCIICPIHGEFWQTPNRHIEGDKCPYCAKNKKLSQDDFINKVLKIYGKKYDFSQAIYVNTDTKVKCICEKHGEFWQTPHHLFKGIACNKCGRERMSMLKISNNSKNFEKKAREVHGNKYDYSKVKYENAYKEVCIICPIHGEFWKTPNCHLNGIGCTKCNSSKLEIDVRRFLEENKVEFEEQKKFNWLGRQRLDFYLPKQNIAIECQGEQHFKPIEYFGGEREFKKRVILDKKKNKLCKENDIKVIYYSKNDYPGMITSLKELKKEVLKDFDDLLN